MEKKSIREVKGEYRLAEWAGLVRECRHSGLNVMTWCEQKGITTNQFYKWQRKVFDALMEQQETQIQGTGLQEPEVQFAELPPPEECETATDRLTESPKGAARRAAVIATLRVGHAEIDIYEGANAAVVEALCKAVRHAE